LGKNPTTDEILEAMNINIGIDTAADTLPLVGRTPL